jgi:hypothetical protein
MLSTSKRIPKLYINMKRIQGGSWIPNYKLELSSASNYLILNEFPILFDFWVW